MQQRFLLQIFLLVQHVSGTTMPIIRKSRVLYSGCCLWYLVLWFSSCWSGVELRVMCPVCRMLQQISEKYVSNTINKLLSIIWCDHSLGGSSPLCALTSIKWYKTYKSNTTNLLFSIRLSKWRHVSAFYTNEAIVRSNTDNLERSSPSYILLSLYR